MNYKAITTLKKADTEGRVPHHTLDKYVRDELAQQLMAALRPALSIDRSDQLLDSESFANQSTVDFMTELVVLKPLQWRQVKEVLQGSIESLAPAQQLAIQQLIDELDC